VAALDGAELAGPSQEAAELLALVAGQDVEEGDDGRFRIARRVAPERVISTVDTEARHGHKSRNRHFDGYKAHVSVDPDSELIDDVVVTPANTPDADAVADLLADHQGDEAKPTVMGDCAYAGADTIAELEDDGFEVMAKVPPATNRDGHYSKDDFDIDAEAHTVGCPGGHVVAIRLGSDGGGRADFGERCDGCPLHERCTTSASGRSIRIHPREDVLQRAKAAQSEPEWQQAYRSTRPKVERKIAHFVRAGWGGRRARTRGRLRVTTDAATRAAAVNWARLATLGVSFTDGRWTAAAT
jgi:IS5 family transposase